LKFTYKGKTTKIRRVTGDYCSKCGEMIVSKEDGHRVSHEMTEFVKKINSGLVDPSFVSRVRKKLRLDQREAAEIFGGGINAFSRYENGKTKPPLALVHLLKLLDKHPELLQELKADAAS
jgi:HTH-type transcriptional regulator/antitoxin MqsA